MLMLKGGRVEFGAEGKLALTGVSGWNRAEWAEEESGKDISSV